jgi:hypothetical protein
MTVTIMATVISFVPLKLEGSVTLEVDIPLQASLQVSRKLRILTQEEHHREETP